MAKFVQFAWKQYFNYNHLLKNRASGIEYTRRNRWKTKYEILYWIDDQHKNEYIIIPKGYEFDFNSVPCFGTCIVWREEFMIALIHDFLYWIKGKINILDKEDLSLRFRNIKSWYWYSIDDTEYLYDRQISDTIWLNGAQEEHITLQRSSANRRIYFWYLFIRLIWSRNFRKLI